MTYKKLPGVLSFQRLMNVSDGVMYNHFNNASRTPLEVIRHGVLGTQNVNGKKTEINNIQTTESGKTVTEANGFEVEFHMWFTPLSKALFACANTNSDSLNETIQQDIQNFIDSAANSPGLEDVCCRYARNVLNGSWLWKRNLLLGQTVTVTVQSDTATYTSNALTANRSNFDNYTSDEKALGQTFQHMLQGKAMGERVKVNATVLFGFEGAVEVYPSQNYLASNELKGFARSLFKVSSRNVAVSKDPTNTWVVGWAALRDQKIANALRTIDTWYPQYPTTLKAIAVEPNGASIEAQVHFRLDNSSFKIMRNIVNTDPNTDDGKFLIASLIRGGVYSETEKDKDKSKDKKTSKKEEATQEDSDEV